MEFLNAEISYFIMNAVDAIKYAKKRKKIPSFDDVEFVLRGREREFNLISHNRTYNLEGVNTKISVLVL